MAIPGAGHGHLGWLPLQPWSRPLGCGLDHFGRTPASHRSRELVNMLSTADPRSVAMADLRVRRVGEPSLLSPMAGLVRGRASSPHYVHESDRVLLDDTLGGAEARLCDV